VTRRHSVLADAPSLGCFVYLARPLVETPELVRALLRATLDGLRIDPQHVRRQRAGDGHVRRGAWLERGLHLASASDATRGSRLRRFRWPAIDEALGPGGAHELGLLVGTTIDVHLTGRLDLATAAPPYAAWLVAETDTWPVAQLAPVLRSWLALAAAHGEPWSGGVFAAPDLRRAKIEASLEPEAGDAETFTPSELLFRHRLRADAGDVDLLRRVYPLTLVGPRIAQRIDLGSLRRAGAVEVTPIGASLLVQATRAIAPAWDPAHLAATAELRRFLWPLTRKNAADAAGLEVDVPWRQRALAALPEPPLDAAIARHLPADHDRFLADVRAEIAREERALAALLAGATPGVW
jgi:hypothetical protein